MKNHIYAKTNSGKVKGEILNGYCSFKGIPYARAERICPPQPVTWEEILDCTDFGKKAMQDFEKEDPRRKPQSREEFDEDCLNLNVYLPRKDVCVSEEGWILKQKQGLPVLVEIHGGAFQTGSNQDHTPKQIIREHDFIYVAVNYRLGVLDFFTLEKFWERNGREAPITASWILWLLCGGFMRTSQPLVEIHGKSLLWEAQPGQNPWEL